VKEPAGRLISLKVFTPAYHLKCSGNRENSKIFPYDAVVGWGWCVYHAEI